MRTYSLTELANITNSRLNCIEPVDIWGVGTLKDAQVGQIACLYQHHQLSSMNQSMASAVVTTNAFANDIQVPCLISQYPLDTIAAIAQQLNSSVPQLPSTIDSRAKVSSDAKIANGVDIGPFAVICDGVQIGEGTRIGAYSIIESNASLGKNNFVGSGTVIGERCVLEDKVRIGSNTIIGSGAYNPKKTKGSWQLEPALGAVVIGQEVEIGSNCCVDRGVFADTLIMHGCKIDNLVQIGHDVCIQSYTAIAGCVGIGAHTDIGRHCIIGGGSSIAGNLHIADNIVLTGTAVVSRSLKKEDVYSSGTTVQAHQRWRKNAARFHHLDTYVRRLKTIERQLNTIKQGENY